jgi:polyhydroxyalkanoate synthesis regulator phasin
LNVLDVLKRTLDFGLGAAALSVEKVKQFSDEMVARGEITTEDARQFVDEVSAKADEQKRSLQEWISEHVAGMLRQAGAAETAHVEQLEARVAELERMVAELKSGLNIGSAGEESDS